MPEATIILNAAAIQRALTRIAHEIAERNESGAEVVLAGIPLVGDQLAFRLGKILSEIWKLPVPVGVLDVSMHRDDLAHRAAPQVHQTVMPFDVTGRTVVLVDDVFFTGRTTRAAMDALNDFGRPKNIPLSKPEVVVVHDKQIASAADFVGKNVPTALTEKVRVRLDIPGQPDEVVLEK